MLKACALDFGRNWDKHLPLVKFAYNQSIIGMPPFEALYGKKCRSPICWEVGNRRMFGLDIIQETTDKIKLIKERMEAAQSRQKAYADKRHRSLEFSVGDKIFLKVSPMKEMVRTGKRNKLNPRYIWPFEILDKIGPIAYCLALPLELERIQMYLIFLS